MIPEHLAKPDDWERFRSFLLVMARVQTGTRWKGKLDASGLVQQTLLEAFKADAQLAHANDHQKAAWLKRALANNLNDEVRRLTTNRRDVGRERSLEAALDESMSRLELLLPAGDGTPSQEAVRAERLLQLSQALSELPENQRQAIELHHLRGLPLVEVATEMNLTKPAVAGLLHRGLKKLRELLTRGDTEE
jgi:RNA polymerase sigma-70 factor, ECF subfamily